MWQPATYTVESLISWFVNRVLIGDVQGEADIQSIRSFMDTFPAHDPRAYFRVPHERPLPPQWLWEQPGELTGSFGFPSDLPSGDPTNDRVRGVALFHPMRQRGPAMILLHGWITPGHAQSKRIARELLRYGFSTFMLELPYHMRRTPRGSFSGTRMIQPDLRVLVETLRQAVADLLKLIRGLRTLGYNQIHLSGISLGAYISTLTASLPQLQQPLASLTAIMPLVDIGFTFQHSAMLSAGRRLLHRLNIDPDEIARFFEPLKLTHFVPQVPKEQRLIISARDDQVAFAHKVRELWEAWDKPAIYEEPHGHVSMIFALEPFRKMAKHVGRRAAQHILTPKTSPQPTHQHA